MFHQAKQFKISWGKARPYILIYRTMKKCEYNVIWVMVNYMIFNSSSMYQYLISQYVAGCTQASWMLCYQMKRHKGGIYVHTAVIAGFWVNQ